MICRFTDIRHKEVVNIKDGTKYGCVNDIMLDTKTASVTAIIIYGHPRFFGIFGREDDFIIRWNEISTIGDDIILVDCRSAVQREKKKSFWNNFFTDD